MSIESSIVLLKERIKGACARTGRNVDDIMLVAVTKTIDVDRIIEAVDCGVNILGENKVQEIMDKYDQIHRDVSWHMIGHLQTNKVKYIVDKVSMIHSVDSLKLVEEIDKRFKSYGRIIDILVEINIGREESKHGINPEDTLQFIQSASKYNNVRIMGLMAVAPAFEDLEKVRPYFRSMKELFDDVKEHRIDNVDMTYLSMGMTNDFEIALEEGSNIIRIGTGIFGPRNNLNLKGGIIVEQ